MRLRWKTVSLLTAVTVSSVTVPLLQSASAAAAPADPSGTTSTLQLPAAVPEGPGTRSLQRSVAETGERTVSPFSLLGVTWADPWRAYDVEVLVRTRTGGGWTEWSELHTSSDVPTDAEAARPGLRGGTEPMWAGASDGVQVKVVVNSGPAPEDLRVDLVDPGTGAGKGPEKGATAGPRGREAVDTPPPWVHNATSGAGKPAIVSRAGWGADEKMRDRSLKYTDTVKAAFVHHTADGNGYSCNDTASVLRAIYRYHVKSNGWADVGYNFIVDKCGKIYEGRAGGVDKSVLGAHTLGFNSHTMGVAALGTYTKENPPQVMVDSLERLIAWKLSVYKRNPLGKVTLTSGDSGSRYKKGVKHSFDVISGHRDAFNTECPGGKLYAKLPEIRNEVKRLMG